MKIYSLAFGTSAFFLHLFQPPFYPKKITHFNNKHSTHFFTTNTEIPEPCTVGSHSNNPLLVICCATCWTSPFRSFFLGHFHYMMPAPNTDLCLKNDEKMRHIQPKVPMHNRYLTPWYIMRKDELFIMKQTKTSTHIYHIVLHISGK